MKNNITELVFILDRSGSMAGFEADTIGGFNATIEKQKKQDGKVYVSTVLFDNESEVIHDRVDINEIRPMTENEYQVGGCTALLDAIGGAIHHIGNIHKYARPEDVPEHTIFVITTDGMENASHRYSSQEIKSKIKRQSENKNMVSRILADERYLGNETFPRLVDSNNFNLAKNIRAEKGGKKAVLTPLMATVKDMLYCAECGETFSRINKWRTREKWLCKGKCKCSVYLDDRTICESILSVLNRAIREPNLLTAPAKNTDYIGSIEVIRKSNEVNRLLEQTEIDYKRAATMILDCASERYKCCVLGGGKHVSNALSSEYGRLTEQSELDEALLKRTVKKITVGHTGEFTVYFIGDIALTKTPKHTEAENAS